MKINKVIILLGCVALAVAVFAGEALAVRGPQGVANTSHNLSTSGNIAPSNNEDEICVFCHTPHGSSTDGPLWNRNNSSVVYTHYTSSTLSTFVASTRTANVNPESMLCLSCHDGSISMYTVINPTNDVGQPTPAVGDGTMRDGFLNIQGPKIGQGRNPDGTVNPVSNDLSDDHPISFKYQAVHDDTTKNNAARLHTIAEAEAAGVRFLPENAPDADKRVECSSCHDPHVDYGIFTGDPNYKPFLITPNTGSALCLACHIK
ncbi:hypothetical protein C2E25_11185 [Geothermobacter hydrogeniphilus]|uniref:Doubled CXXCH domain-containing protein n=1 Tax=Geothermobacter hydrogeniphilus TaxID=1969733 RepID=A0A2K2H8W5_9BACT|nr:cytochrome c3 family protein [Geothermobacter hydrogeniphilus]PNU19660.1 hypothetical protein C2E25_11185 [Geothermobacter hydrogeniphilus]